MILKIEDDKVKEDYFNFLKEKIKIPICKKCKKLFKLGFPNKEDYLSDYLICEDNDLLCSCENFKELEEKYNSSGDESIDIKNYYE